MCKLQESKRLWSHIMMVALFLLNSTWAFAQSTVNGVVKDSAGEPLIGVNVIEKGTTNGTVTDVDGKFTMSVAPGKTLLISYIGYKTQEVAAGRNLNIILAEDNAMLDEVVVVGYGSMTRKDVLIQTLHSCCKVKFRDYLSHRAVTLMVELLLSNFVVLHHFVVVLPWNLIM